MEPRIQYAKTSDGVNIAYAEFGEGPPLIVVGSPGLCHALSYKVFEYFYQPLAARFRVVDYDSRGSGLSDRDAIDFSMEAMISDLEAVVAEKGFDSFVLVAVISGVPIAVTTQRRIRSASPTWSSTMVGLASRTCSRRLPTRRMCNCRR
jgi:pimeloyl-ACP methyl ester carboxylesterase